MTSRWRTPEGNDFNLTPLLDVIFCLLFFLMLATTLRPQRHALEVQVPGTDQSTRTFDDAPPVQITIAGNNTVWLGDEELTLDDLEGRLVRSRRETGAEQALIRADGLADVQVFVEVSDACARAGFGSALMETRQEENSSQGIERTP